MDIIKINAEDNLSEENGNNIVDAGEIRKYRKKSHGNFSVYLFYGLVFLAPIFYLPFIIFSAAASKISLIGIGAALSAFFWLLSRLREGRIRIPKSAVLFGAGGLLLAWFVSAIFAGKGYLPLIGKIYEWDTVIFMAFGAILLFMATALFQSEKRAFNFYLLLLISSATVFAFQVAHIFFGFGQTELFPFKNSNLIGNWTDFSIFFGLVGLVAMSFLEFFKFGGYMKTMFYIALIMSFLAMMAVGFFPNLAVFGLFAFILFIRFLSEHFYSDVPKASNRRSYLSVSLLALLAVVSFIFIPKLIPEETKAVINNKITGPFVEISPFWSSTMDVIKKSLKDNPALGSGPNTFAENWAKFKPLSLNGTIFWNARFSSGAGYFPSTVATTGLFGAAAIIAFFLAFLFYGKKVFLIKQEDLGGVATKVSFLGATYLWIFAFIYTPGPLILSLAFIITGVMVGLLARNGSVKLVEFNITRGSKMGFVFVLVLIFLLIGSASLLFLHSRKVLAFYNYNQAVKEFNFGGDLDKTAQKLFSAIKLDDQDEYYRAMSELGLAQLAKILADKNTPAESLRVAFEQNLKISVDYAGKAVAINPVNPFNWMQLGKIYESVASLKIKGADNAADMAISSYAQIMKISPVDSYPYLASARVAVQSNKLDEAKKYLEQAIGLKPDYSDALFLSAQIDAQQGNLKKAIASVEKAVAASPSVGALFQLGLLYYQDKNIGSARAVFEEIVRVSADYANARYFLGLIYDKQGLTEKAIEQFENIKKNNPENNEVKKILSNLKSGKSALDEIAPPPPEKRTNPPISEEEQNALNKNKNN